MKLQIDETNNENEIRFVSDELDRFNESIVGKENHKKLNLVIKNDNNEIIAGLLGGTYWGWFYVDRLWVHDIFRKQGIGKVLLRNAEELAVKRGCYYSHLDTMSWQALEFYKKQGYIVLCEIKDIPKGHSKYHLMKNLKLQ